jgi:hypothetical protein
MSHHSLLVPGLNAGRPGRPPAFAVPGGIANVRRYADN